MPSFSVLCARVRLFVFACLVVVDRCFSPLPLPLLPCFCRHYTCSRRFADLTPVFSFLLLCALPVHEMLTEAIKLVANEPSVGLYFVQQHVQKAVPALVSVKVCAVLFSIFIMIARVLIDWLYMVKFALSRHGMNLVPV